MRYMLQKVALGVGICFIYHVVSGYGLNSVGRRRAVIHHVVGGYILNNVGRRRVGRGRSGWERR